MLYTSNLFYIDNQLYLNGKKEHFLFIWWASPVKLHEFWRRGAGKLELHTKLWRPVLRWLERQKCNREEAGRGHWRAG